MRGSKKVKKTKQQGKKITRRKRESQVEVNPESIYTIFDALDDGQIISSLQGEAMKDYVYSFVDKKSGRTITQLSKIGVDMACSSLAKRNMIIREIDLTFTDGPEEALFISRAGRYEIDRKSGREILLDTKIGQKRQEKNILVGDRDRKYSIPNKFWFEQGGQKALRNARRDLIPANFIAKLIGEWIKAGNVRTITADKPEQKTEKPVEKKGLPGPTKITLPEIKSTTICQIGKFEKVPMLWHKLPLQDLLYFQGQAVNPMNLEPLIRDKMMYLLGLYTKQVKGGGMFTSKLMWDKFHKKNEEDLTNEEFIALLRELKKLCQEQRT